MPRKYCGDCNYPLSTCVCDSVAPVHSDINILLMQHPKEVRHAKNTGKLVRLGIINSQIVVGESALDFHELALRVKANPDEYALLYPSDNSQAIEDVITAECRKQPKHLIFIDSTWRKALKIYSLNPWLWSITQWHFEQPPESGYHIRKTRINHARSTIESVIYCLDRLTKTDTQGLSALFKRMQAHHLQPK